jgi:hypothetical protein
VGEDTNPEAGRFKLKMRVAFALVSALSGLSLHSAFELSLKGIHRPKGQLGCGIHVSNARLKLQKILPRTIHVGLRTGFVTHADEHSLLSSENEARLYQTIR